MNRSAGLRSRWAAIGAAVAVTVGATGIGGYNLVNADVSSGDRSILVPMSPCRLTDTRPAPDNVGPRTSPLGAKDTMTVATSEPGTDCSGKIPSTATAVALNVTAVNSSANSFLTLWAGGDRPGTASLNPAANEILFNAVTTELDPAGAFRVYNEAGSTDVVIDVTGYYDDHNHDDRYERRIDEIVVSGFQFAEITGTAWKFEILWSHSGPGKDCIAAPINIPPGRSIVDVSIVYSAPADTLVDTSVVGTIQRPKTGLSEANAGHVIASLDGTLPATALTTITAAPMPMASPTPAISDEFGYGVFMCARGSFNLASIVITLD